MCVAIPGEVIEIDGNIATIDFQGNIVKARCGLVEVQLHDYVLVHAGCVIQKMKQSEAEEIASLMAGLD